jgi:hypothetical protein
MKIQCNALLVFGMALFGLLPSASAAGLEEGFRNPTEETKPWAYWYWLSNDVTEEGITKDLEAMKHTGIVRAMIGNIEGGGPVKMFSPEWYRLTRHALKEANRLDIDLFMFNAPGWSQSGGPWIKPEQSMRRVIWNEIPAQGGTFSARVRNEPQRIKLQTHRGGAGAMDHEPQDIAVLALPRKKTLSVLGQKPGGGNADKALVFERDAPFTARSLVVKGKLNGKLFAVRNGEREAVAQIDTGGRNPKTDFLADGIETFSFQEVTAREFILEPCPLPGGQVELRSAPTVAQVIEKQLGRMHPTPSPRWDSYIFPATVEPADPSLVIRPNEIIDLSDQIDDEGVLTCELPAGEWTILYFGMVTTGMVNSPAPPEATGLEVDKMSRPLIEHHFTSMFGPLLDQLTPGERQAFVGITIDSYEKGAQNWTDDFLEKFEKRNGYSPLKLLPVFTGRVVESAKTSDGFLWDLRRTVADMIATEYVGGLNEIAHEHDLSLWCENYGHWGFPGEFLIYGGHADMIGGEFWSNQNLGGIECRAASSAAHIYGKPTVYAEAFTSRLNLGHHPYSIKARGEQLFSKGINHFVLHVYAAQPRDGVPGKNSWFGTAFHRNTPWFNHAQGWVKYLQRCHLMLQMGRPAAEVAVYIGDFAPQMTGPANPVPTGYDYDYMGSDALLRTVELDGGDLVVRDEDDPDRIAARYKVLAANAAAMEKLRPQVRTRIEALVKNGATMVDQVPVPAATLGKLGIGPMVSKQTCPIEWTVRELDDGKIFFLSNFGKTGPFEVTLRASGKAPGLFNPVTGQTHQLARYWNDGAGTRVAFNVRDRADSFFVVFRDDPESLSVLKVTSDGKAVSTADLALWYDDKGRLVGQTTEPGRYALSMSDGTQRTLDLRGKTRRLPVEGPWKTTGEQDDGFTLVRQTEFTLPADFGKGQPVVLDLGDVQVMAKVTLNGKTYDTLWMPPFELDVTEDVQPGNNRLSVTVTSTSKGKPKIGAVTLRTVLEGEIGN